MTKEPKIKKTIKFKSLKEKLTKEGKPYFVLTIEDLELILRSPTRNEVAIVTKMNHSNEIKATEYLLINCALGGDLDAILDDVDYFLAARDKLDTIYDLKEASIKNLENKQFEITVGDKQCVIKKPSVTDLGVIMSYSEKYPMKSNEEFLERCWVSGDDAIKTDDEYFLSILQVLKSIVQAKESDIKKN